MSFLLTLPFVFLMLAVALSYIMPFLKARPAITVAQSKFRIALVFVLMVAVPPVLAFISLSQLSSYTSFSELWTESRLAGILFPLHVACILLAGFIVPFSTFSYFYSAYRKFLAKHDYEIISADSKDQTLAQLYSIFSDCLNVAKVEANIKLLVSKEPLVSDCGIVGKGKNAAMLLSQSFIDFFQSGKLTENDVKAVFLHELSHVLHNDHFMPLWALGFVRSKVFTYTIISFLVAISLLFLSGYLAGTFAIRGNLLRIASLLIIIPMAFLVFKVIIYRLVARIMREREFLADAHSAYFYAQDKMAATLKKSALLPAKASFLALSFVGIGKPEWHPSIMSRIEALGQKKEPEPKQGKMPSALQMLSYCMYFTIVLALLFVTSAVLPDIARYITMLGWVLSFLVVTTLVIENIFPLHSLGRQSLAPFLLSKLWVKIHLNDAIIALTVCSLTALSSLVFPDAITYIHWHKTFFFRAVLFYFLYCTGFSALLVAIYWREKKKPEIEVPIEVAMK